MAGVSVHVGIPILKMGEGHGLFELAELLSHSHVDLGYFVEVCGEFMAAAPSATKHVLQLKCNAEIGNVITI